MSNVINFRLMKSISNEDVGFWKINWKGTDFFPSSFQFCFVVITL